MTIHLGCPLPDTSSNQPEPRVEKTPRAYTGEGTATLCGSYSVLLLAGFAVPFLLPETRCALTAPFHPYPPTPLRASARQALAGLPRHSLREQTKAGGIFSVALSLIRHSLARTSDKPPDVIRRHFPLEPGLSSLPKRQSGHPAVWRNPYSRWPQTPAKPRIVSVPLPKKHR